MYKHVEDIGLSDDVRKRVMLAFRDDVPLPIELGTERELTLRIETLQKQVFTGDIVATAVDLDTQRYVKLHIPRKAASRASADISPR